VQVQVIHALAPVATGVGHDPIPTRIEPELGGNLRCEGEQPAEQSVSRLSFSVAHGTQVRHRDNEDVCRRYRLYVPEGNEVRRLLDHAGVDLAPCDLAEDAISH